MEFGNFDLCLNVKSLEASTEFYKKLDFENTRFDAESGFSIMKRKDVTLALYDDSIEETMLNFRGGNIEQIVKELENRGLKTEGGAVKESDGSMSATLRDPDGNLIYYNTAPGEELY